MKKENLAALIVAGVVLLSAASIVVVSSGRSGDAQFDPSALTEFSYVSSAATLLGGDQSAYRVTTFESFEELCQAAASGINFGGTTFYLADDLPVYKIDKICGNLGLDTVEYRTSDSRAVSGAGTLLMTLAVIAGVGAGALFLCDNLSQYRG